MDTNSPERASGGGGGGMEHDGAARKKARATRQEEERRLMPDTEEGVKRRRRTRKGEYEGGWTIVGTLIRYMKGRQREQRMQEKCDRKERITW